MTEPTTDLTGKVAMITGASRGIGAEAARAFAAAGARVALLARSEEAIAALAGEIGDAAVAIPCDVSRYWEVETAVNATIGAFGRLDILVGNAGVIEPIGRMAELDPDAWGQTIDINLKGVFHGMRAALPVMLSQGGGTIVTVSSGAAHGPVEGWSAYCASKAGAAMLTRMLDEEYAAAGIRAMGLSPGTVATDMQREIKASGINRVSRLDWSDHIPPDWPAKALVWMCGPEAADRAGTEVSLRDEGVRATLGLSR
ncbi:MAG: SDR family NAD(P)-dependent oxidoreductase [Alphaproteobacteria bacterium]|jgi:NAD(P)-dependent dehydrogenase (short-subunit alcohol dehydrogenase family)|nr:SDR family NAD(P)-dependent oxidoreductase [Alphaproteobacteria bacterium]